MNQDEIKSNLLDANHWLRIVFMVCFGFAAWFVLGVLAVLVFVQLIISLVAGSPNVNLQKTGYQFASYLQEIFQFLLYNRHEKPFPFADFPSGEQFVPPPPPPREVRAAATEPAATKTAAPDTSHQASTTHATGTEASGTRAFGTDSVMTEPEPENADPSGSVNDDALRPDSPASGRGDDNQDKLP